LNHITIFFTNPPPKDLPSYLLSPTPINGISAPTTPSDAPQTPVDEPSAEWSFLPRYTSALAACKWGLSILEQLANRVSEFLGWGEDTADAIRIAVGGIRERIVRAIIVAWHDGLSFLGIFANSVDAEHFYVLEDWVIDKSRGSGVTGWVSACHGYQQQVIKGLEAVVKYSIFKTLLT
jgi:Exocyst complex component Sec5